MTFESFLANFNNGGCPGGGDGVLEKEVSHDNPQKPKPKPARAVDVKDDEVH